MPLNISKEQFWKLYEGLPQELKDALFAPETGEQIEQTCQKYGVETAQADEIISLVGRVLLGLALPEDFQAVLENDLKMKKEIAKNVNHEINRFIFYPVKESLAGLHKIEAKPSSGLPTGTSTPITRPTSPSAETKIPAPSAAPQSPRTQDTYRENVE